MESLSQLSNNNNNNNTNITINTMVINNNNTTNNVSAKKGANKRITKALNKGKQRIVCNEVKEPAQCNEENSDIKPFSFKDDKQKQSVIHVNVDGSVAFLPNRIEAGIEGRRTPRKNGKNFSIAMTDYCRELGVEFKMRQNNLAALITERNSLEWEYKELLE